MRFDMKVIENCRIKEAAFIRHLDKGCFQHMLLFAYLVSLDSPSFYLSPPYYKYFGINCHNSSLPDEYQDKLGIISKQYIVKEKYYDKISRYLTGT